MPQSPATLLIAYGIFLTVSGIAGYVATHATSTSALLNGGVFGTLMIVLGLTIRRGRMWTYPAAASAAVIFTLTFAWRSALQWYAVLQGDDDKLLVAALLTLMGAVSADVSRRLIRSYRH